MSSGDFDVDELTDEWDRTHDRKTPADWGTPVEMRFVLDVRDHPDDMAMRMVYADWLEQHGKPERAELVRLLTDPPDEASPMRVRLKILGQREHREWMAVIGRGGLEGCRPEFRFKCPKRWESLSGTDMPDVRHCEQCDRQVHFCVDLHDVERNARAGHCVAVSSMLLRGPAADHYQVTAREDDDVMMGEMADPSEWTPPTPGGTLVG